MTSLSTSGVVVWEWLNEFGRWRPYEPHVSDFVEGSWAGGACTGVVGLGLADPMLLQYAVDFTSKQQIKMGTSQGRPIRRQLYADNSPAGTGVSWQWLGDLPNQWHPYDMEVAMILEDCFNKKMSHVDLSQYPCCFPYTVDFKQMTQTRNETGFLRQVKRIYTGKKYMTATGTKRINLSNANISMPGQNGVIVNPSLPGGATNMGSSAPSSVGMVKKRSGSQSGGSPKKVMTRASVRSLAGQNHGIMPGIGGAAPHRMPSYIPHMHNMPLVPPGMNGTFFSGFPGMGVGPSSSSSSLSSSSSTSNSSRHSSRRLASRLTPAMTGMTSMLVSPAVPVRFSASPASLPHGSLHLPLISSSQTSTPSTGGATSSALGAEDALRPYVSVVSQPPRDEDCCICCESLTSSSGYDSDEDGSCVYKLKKCEHLFHKACLHAMYESGTKDGHLVCPTCKTIYGEKMGNCPAGKMDWHVLHGHSLPGNEDCDTIRIIYFIPPGVQGPEHPHPGRPYTARGFPRHCYLPNSEKGKKVLRLLKKAWDRRLLFTIGTSATTGEADTVVWNEIHHKTEFGSNHTGHGYPDPNYLDNVLLELQVHGVTEES